MTHNKVGKEGLRLQMDALWEDQPPSAALISDHCGWFSPLSIHWVHTDYSDPRSTDRTYRVSFQILYNWSPTTMTRGSRGTGQLSHKSRKECMDRD